MGIKPCLRGADTHISNLLQQYQIFVKNTELQTGQKKRGMDITQFAKGTDIQSPHKNIATH